jgi:uncharacterized membrane protein YtjA (UPF0391 family)
MTDGFAGSGSPPAATLFWRVGRNQSVTAAVLDTSDFKEMIMLYWALVFLVVAIIAGALGFGGIAGTSAGIAQILFFIFLAFLVIALLAGFFRRA